MLSPSRPAKNDLPFTTASPDIAEEMTDNSVDTTRGSNTTVQRPDFALVAPNIRTARSTASWAATSGSSEPGPRPTLKPPPVWLSAPSPAIADTERKAEVRLVNAVMPVVDASATSTLPSP